MVMLWHIVCVLHALLSISDRLWIRISSVKYFADRKQHHTAWSRISTFFILMVYIAVLYNYIQSAIYVIVLEKRDHFAVELFFQYKQIKVDTQLGLHINPNV